MANPFATWVKNIRFSVQNPWILAKANLANIGLDYVTSALEKIIDLDAANGTLVSATVFQEHVAAPKKVKVDAGTTWTEGWWQAGNGSWWYLGNTADVASFARGDAEFYMPTGDILDVPLS